MKMKVLKDMATDQLIMFTEEQWQQIRTMCNMHDEKAAKMWLTKYGAEDIKNKVNASKQASN